MVGTTDMLLDCAPFPLLVLIGTPGLTGIVELPTATATIIRR